MLFSLVPEPWRDVLASHEDLINSIGRELQQRADKGERILPDRKWVFRSLEMIESSRFLQERAPPMHP